MSFHAPAAQVSQSSFASLSQTQLESHVAVGRYGEFFLPDGICPSYDLKVVPRQGYRFDAYHGPNDSDHCPAIMGAASRECLFDLFIDLIDCVVAGDSCEADQDFTEAADHDYDNTVDVVLESSHHENDYRSTQGHVDLFRHGIELPILKSILCDFEDLLVNDCFTGIAVLNSQSMQEVQFDEHKLLICYSQVLPLNPFVDILERHGVRHDETIKFITEAEHVHMLDEQSIGRFEELREALGAER